MRSRGTAGGCRRHGPPILPLPPGHVTRPSVRVGLCAGAVDAYVALGAGGLRVVRGGCGVRHGGGGPVRRAGGGGRAGTGRGAGAERARRAGSGARTRTEPGPDLYATRTGPARDPHLARTGCARGLHGIRTRSGRANPRDPVGVRARVAYAAYATPYEPDGPGTPRRAETGPPDPDPAAPAYAASGCICPGRCRGSGSAGCIRCQRATSQPLVRRYVSRTGRPCQLPVSRAVCGPP